MIEIFGRLGTALFGVALLLMVAAGCYLAAAFEITASIEKAVKAEREARDAFWNAEIEKSNKAVLAQQAEAEAQLKTVEADASERIRRAEQLQITMDQDNDKMADDGGRSGLDRAHVRMLPN